jgi:hypothetical protein
VYNSQRAGFKKKYITSLFSHYKKMINSTHQETDSQLREQNLMQYTDAINSEVFVADEDASLITSDAYASQRPLFASIFLRPGT